MMQHAITNVNTQKIHCALGAYGTQGAFPRGKKVGLHSDSSHSADKGRKGLKKH
jgi:hypothetical protein